MQADIVSYYELYNFTKQYVTSYRTAARAGRKDEARDFLKYVRCARIIQILKPIDFSQIGLVSVDVSHLEWQLSELEQECHPSAPNDQTSDIAAIRSMLEIVASGIQMLLLQKTSLKTNL
jgi:hypothetical protein